MHKRNESNLAFGMITIMHDNPLLWLVKNPYKILQAIGVEEGQTVLDVGCGPGYFTIPAAKLVGEKGNVIALDNHPLAVRGVEKKAKKAGLQNIKLLLADAAKTGLPEASVDLAFLFGFVHAINSEFLDALTELKPILKRDGKLVIERTPWVKESDLLASLEENGFRVSDRWKRLFSFQKSEGSAGP